uniref:Uncharacterized protein n=1 Tax=Cacopsylla melanoneura TaxID=428564 RepID=A0A8D8PWC7_9HEMI
MRDAIHYLCGSELRETKCSLVFYSFSFLATLYFNMIIINSLPKLTHYLRAIGNSLMEHVRYFWRGLGRYSLYAFHFQYQGPIPTLPYIWVDPSWFSRYPPFCYFSKISEFFLFCFLPN